MPGSREIRAGRAYVELSTRANKFNKGLAAAAARLKAWGTAVSLAGLKLAAGAGIILAPLILATKSAIALGSELLEMSQRTGLSVETLSELKFAAEQSGNSIESIEKSVRKMQQQLGKGEQSKAFVETIKSLGLELDALKKLDPEQQFLTLAAAISKVKDPTQRTAAAMAVFGREGAAAMLNLLSEGPAGLEKMRKAARDLGLVMSQEDAVALEAMGDALDILWKSVKQGAVAVGTALLPVLSEMVAEVQSLLPTVLAWIKENKELVGTVFKIALAAGAAGLSLAALGAIIGGVGTALSGLALLATPIGLVVAALAGLAAGAVWVHQVSQAYVELADAQTKLAAAGDAQRASDQALFAQLEELAAKQRLTGDEMRAAQTIIDDLNGRYAGMNLALDKATGRVADLADAQQFLNDKMRDQAKIDVGRALQEAQLNVQRLTGEFERANGFWQRLGRVSTTVWGDSEQSVIDLMNKLTVAQQEAKKLQDRMDALQNGNPAAITGGAKAPTETATPPAVDAAESADAIAKREAQEAAARAARDAAESGITSLEIDLNPNLTELQKALAKLELEFQQGMREALENGLDPELVQREFDLRRRLLEQEAAAKKEADETATRNTAEDQANRIRELEIQADPDMTEADKKIAELEIQFEDAMRDALEKGLDPELVQRQFDLRREIALHRDEVDTKSGIAGTFNASIASRLAGGGGDTQERILAVAEKSEKHLRNLKNNQPAVV